MNRPCSSLEAINTPWGRVTIRRSACVSSTNALARAYVDQAEKAESVLIIAEQQTGGEGRRGRSWHSPPGGLWATLAWPVAGPLAPVLDGLGLRLGVACLRTIDSVTGRPLGQLKWPNDVLIRGRKVCGMLCEHRCRGDTHWLLPAVGINANNRPDSLPGEVAAGATCLADEVGTAVDLGELARKLVLHVIAALQTPSMPPEVLSLARARLALTGTEQDILKPDGTACRAFILGLDDLGQLRYRTDRGEEQCRNDLEIALPQCG